MLYTKLQKIIASIIIPIFFFGMVFRFPLDFFNVSDAGNTKLYSLVSILVNQEIYSDTKEKIKRYGEDISKQLKNTKVVIIPVPKDAKPFNIASLNEKLFYEGYEGVTDNSNFKSRLVGTVFIGDLKLPVVYDGEDFSKTILPYVDFDNKEYIYDRINEKYIKNNDNKDALRPEIWHGAIIPNTGDKEKDIVKINDYFDKNHDFYEGKGNFKKENAILNGKLNEEVSEEYKPYVFYFDQFREQQTILLPKYRGYQAYLSNKEDIVYKRYSKELAEKIRLEALSESKKEIKLLLDDLKFDYKIGKDKEINNDTFDLSGVPDVTTKYITDNVSKKFLETFNSSKIGNFRKDVHNAGRYSVSGKKINIDIIPYLISSLDLISDGVIKEVSDDIEGEIDNVVINELAKEITIPTKYTRDSTSANNCGDNSYSNYFHGTYAGDLKTASDCTIFRGNTNNSGTLVEANRGLDIYLANHDINLETFGCVGSDKGRNPQGIYAGSSPLNLETKDTTGLKLKSYNLNKAILPLFDIKGSKKAVDSAKNPSPLNCLNNNFIKTYSSYWEGGDDGDGCVVDYEIFKTGYRNNWGCTKENISTKNYNKDSLKFKKIPSYIFHKSPTNEEFNKILKVKYTPNLPIDKERYIDFFSSPVNAVTKKGKESYKKIVYPNLFKIKGTSQSEIDAKLRIILKKKSDEIKKLGANIDLIEFLKNKSVKKVKILGEEKEISYYDSIVFAIFWNNFKNVPQKYKFVFENYLVDQTSTENKFFLPKNKKIYDIAYIGASGDSKKMYIGIDPEEKAASPYSNINSQNALIDSNIFTYNFIKTKGEKEKEGLFKCAPPEGVSIFQWPSAVICRLKGLLPPEISFGESKCGSSDLFKDEDDEEEIEKENISCENDINKNGIDDCIENEFKNSKLILRAGKDKAYINTNVKLESKIIRPNGKVFSGITGIYTNYELVKIESVSDDKIVTIYEKNSINELSNKNKNRFIKFKDNNTFNTKGISKYSFTSKNKEANYYFRSFITLKGQTKESEEIILKSEIIKVKIREDLLYSTSSIIDNQGELINGSNGIYANDKSNIYLLDINQSNIDDNLESIKKDSQSKEKLIISLGHFSKGKKLINLNYPLKLSLTRNGKKVIEDINITKANLAKFKSVYSLSKSGEYKLKIINSYGEATTSIFNILPEKASDVDINLSTNILERNGNISSNIVILKDKYGNVSNGFNYELILESLGNFGFPLNNTEIIDKRHYRTYDGFRGFRIKAKNNNGVGSINVDVRLDGKSILKKSKTIQVIEKINLNLKNIEEIKVGGGEYNIEIDFTDKQGNLLKNLDSRVYFNISKKYGNLAKPFFDVKAGKAIIKIKTGNIAGEQVPVDIQIEGMRKITRKFIEIKPDKPIKMEFNISDSMLEASPEKKVKLLVSLKDKYNNLVFSDNSTKLKIEILEKYRKILKLEDSIIKILKKGQAVYNISATNIPGSAYFKVSTIPDLSKNSFELNGKEIKGVGEKAGRIKTYFFWDEKTFEGKKFNSLYTVLLGSNYGDFTQKDYLAGSILFDKNNRSLAITSTLNNPYKNEDVVNVNMNGKIQVPNFGEDLSQDIKISTSIDYKNKLQFSIFNDALNKNVGTLTYNFNDTTKLGVCEDNNGFCSKEKNTISLKTNDKTYIIKKDGDNLYLSKEGNKILEINKNGDFITNNILKFELEEKSIGQNLVINIYNYNEADNVIAQIIINIDNKNIKYSILDNWYQIHNIYNNGEVTKNISYIDPFGTKKRLNSFSNYKEDNIENFVKKESIGWNGENKFLLDFAAGKTIGESVIDKQSFGTIILGDPVVSLKLKKNLFKDGSEKIFTSTIGKKLTKDYNIKNYKTFDYDNDGLDDILLIKDNGFFKLLENKSNSKEFLDKGNLAYIADYGNVGFVQAGDFTGDGYDDIFFVNKRGIPFLLNNKNKDFNRFSLEKQFNLKGQIVQTEGFDMDNDGKFDIVTLDDAGEIHIFYGGKKNNEPFFTQKFIGAGFGLKMGKKIIDTGAFVSHKTIYEIPDLPKYSTGVVNEQFLDNNIFVKINIDNRTSKKEEFKKEDISKNIKIVGDYNYTEGKTFIKSEYAEAVGIKVQKEFTDKNGGALQLGDIVKVKITLENISNETKRDILFVDNIEKPFRRIEGKIKYTKGKKIYPPSRYDYYISKFDLKPGEKNIIEYELKTPKLKFGNILVGLFEKGEIGDDLYGDIIVKVNSQNCSDTFDFFRSESEVRTYSDLTKKTPTCNLEKNKLPDILEKNKIDKDENGIPDYIDEIIDNPNKQKEYAKKELEKIEKDEYENDEDKGPLEILDKINEKTEELLEDMDELLEGFSCGFGGGSCFSTPLNWAPLAPGNDPTLNGRPIGDGLKVNEGIPIFSSMTNCLPVTHGCIPFVWPPISGGAGGYLGTNYALNNFRLFVTPTLTGGVGTAMCFGGPASVAGNSNPKGVSPVVPGGNCIVVAMPLPGCENDGSKGDPSVLGPITPEGDYGIINANCNKDLNVNRILNRDFIKKYYKNKTLGLGYPTTFETEYNNMLKNHNTSIIDGIDVNSPLQNENVSLDYSFDDDENFDDIEKIDNKRVSAFPDFLMGWVTSQVEEITSKLGSFPALSVVLPEFKGINDGNINSLEIKKDEEIKKVNDKEQEKNNENTNKIAGLINEKSGLDCEGKDKIKCFGIDSKIKFLNTQNSIDGLSSGTNSGLKEVYEFLSNIPIIQIEPQQVRVDIPWPDTNALNKFIVDGKSTLEQRKNEISTFRPNSNVKDETYNELSKLAAKLEQNINIAESYKDIPRQLADLFNIKSKRMNQILCNLEVISELTGGWIGKNGARFESWVRTYIAIKAAFESWQLFIDIFNDYDAECHECKNERNDLLDFEFSLVSMILPKIPVIQFPKWPDLTLDMHNIRMDIVINVPEFNLNYRPIVLPTLPELKLPEANINLDLKLPDMPLLPKFEIPELPDLPGLPEIKLPDLPPPPKLPKLVGEISGVLKVLKLVTKAMCFLKQLPFVPEWRAGDQIAFLTERKGYLPMDFFNLELPQISYTTLDEIRVTTYVNFQYENDSLVEMAKNVVEPINKQTNNFLNQFQNAGFGSLDFSDIEYNADIKVDITGDSEKAVEIKTGDDLGFNNTIVKNILKLNNYIKNNNQDVSVNEFLDIVNKSLASDIFTKDQRTEKITALWKEVNNYTFSKEDKLIKELQKNNREKFDNIKNILLNEIRKNNELKKNINNIQKRNSLFKLVVSNKGNNDFVEYKKSVDKYNKKFYDSAKKLINSKGDYYKKDLLIQSERVFPRIKGGLSNYQKSLKSRSKINEKLLASVYPSNKKIGIKSSCQVDNDSPYKFNYEGIYVVQGDKHYRLFNYMDELDGTEKYSGIDFDNDGDKDLLYFIKGNLYLKENFKIQKIEDISIESPLVLKISDNKFFNGSDFVESVNNFEEINIDNGILNLNFKASTDDTIRHYSVEYYTIVDKFLNENLKNGVRKNIIDAFVDYKNQIEIETGIKKHMAFINYIGDIPAVRFDSIEMKNLGESILKNKKVNISATTPIYSASNSVKIKYYVGGDEDSIYEKKIEKNSSIRFKDTITIIAINGNAYIKGRKKISLVGSEIKQYVGLPLFEESELSLIPDLMSKMNSDLSNIEIAHGDGYSRILNFTEINSYRYYNLGYMSKEYLLRIDINNDFYYGKIYAIKDDIKGSYSSQILFAPQTESDNTAPELDNLKKIRIPVYQKKEIDLRKFIYEDSGIDYVKNIEIKLLENSNIVPDNYKLNKFNLTLGKFNKLFNEKVLFLIEDKNGNKSITPVNIEIYTPKPKILNNSGSILNGKINEKLLGEPINIYRIRSGVIKRLETKENKIKVDTIDEGLFTFHVKSDDKTGLYLKDGLNNIARIDEVTGKIDILNIAYNIKIDNDDLLYPKINIINTLGEKIYSEKLKLDYNYETNIINNFDNIVNEGLYLSMKDENYDFYQIPNGSKYSAGITVIHKKNDVNKKEIFAIFPDGRIRFNTIKYKLKYKSNENYIVFELISRIGNAKIAELLFKIDGTYLIKK